MISWLLNIGLVLLFSIYFSGYIISKISEIAFRKKLFDEIDERKIHKSLVPRLGGIAFKPVMFFTLSFVVGYNLAIGNEEFVSFFSKEAETLAFVFCAVMIIYVVGVCDDLIGINYQAKFLAQVLCGILLITGGLYINDFYGLFGVHSLINWFSYPLTIFLVVFIINAINLIDGIDGLASGLSTIALMHMGISFFYFQEYAASIIAFCLMGVLIPFFYYNVFGTSAKRTKIFMGDTGSMTVGMLLCALSLKLALVAPTFQGPVPNPLILAFSPLIIPGFDVVRVYLGRMVRGVNPFLPDKTHIHHKMMQMGMKQNTVMVILIIASILISLTNIILSFYLQISILLIGDAILWIIMNTWMNRKVKQVNGMASSMIKKKHTYN